MFFSSQGTVPIPDPANHGEQEEDLTPQMNEEAAPLLELEGVSTSPVKATSEGKKTRGLLQPLNAIFTNRTWRTTVILMSLWFGAAWLYYGAILLTTTLYNPHCAAMNWSNSTGDSSGTCEESQLQTSDYLKILWTSAAELLE